MNDKLTLEETEDGAVLQRNDCSRTNIFGMRNTAAAMMLMEANIYIERGQPLSQSISDQCKKLFFLQI